MEARAFLYRRDGALRAPWRLAIFAFVAVAAMWGLQFVASLIAPLAGIQPSDSRILIVNFVILAAALWMAHGVMLRAVDKLPWSYAGLGKEHFAPRPLLAVMILAGLAVAAPSLLLVAIGWLSVAPESGGSAEWLMFALATLAFLAPGALWEELLFRGYIFAVLRETWGWKATIVVTSLLFALVHWQNPGAGPLPLMVVLLAGFFLAGVLLVTSSVVAAWLAHLAWNWTLVGLLHAPVSGYRVPPPAYRLADSGPAWATGGLWGPEGGVFAALGLVIATLFLFRFWRDRREIAE